MGGSIGTFSKRRSDVSSVFVDELLVEGEAVLKTDAALRKDFVEFIKGGSWTENLSSFEDYLSLPASSDSPWRKFAYGSPSHSANSVVSRSSFEVAGSPRSLSCDSGSGRASKSSPVYQKMVLEEFYGAIGDCELFQTEGLRAVLIAALLPQFLRSSEYKASTSTSMDEFDVPEQCIVNVYSNRKPAFERPKSERLQAWLSGAAAMFDSSALENYLADPYSSWVDDYIRALRVLPAVITISTVDPEKKDISMVYSNAPTGGLLSSKNSVKSNILTTFCADMSLHDVERAGKAMFDAKLYKQGVLCTNGLCQLRALKPVFNSRGSYIYALSIESAHFEDPTLQDTDKDKEIVAAVEKPFQQVDNLLLILPLLIRTCKISPEMGGFTRGSSRTEPGEGV
eukprot:CAMPEP_0184967962 /NCGR_PEP_ID=MMETSP1098-20130426/1163_1 /TAXON_ID=89044 /ORGANISM="Spumella elongata, Strain CCAP 955/1" /LENGTH=396 /DNA_ID=CAMNT_0027489499 /DNA_START=49 /DNA_END=1239 /DNA_ORIENTATION=+